MHCFCLENDDKKMTLLNRLQELRFAIKDEKHNLLSSAVEIAPERRKICLGR